MPALQNPQEEFFVQLLKRGVTPYRAFSIAGYKQHRGNCYRLRDRERVKRRLNEVIIKDVAMKTRVTVESLTDEFNDAIELAKETKNPSALTGAALAKGKLHGLIVDRKETGQPGDFSNLQSADEVLDLVRKELGDETARALAAVLLKSQVAEAELEPNVDGSDAVN